MSTNPNSVSTMTRSQILPAIRALTARDFKVCENCGGPAMPHPRFEMAQIVSGEKQVLCCECLHGMVSETRQRQVSGFRIGDQLWVCLVCHRMRAWGLLEPWDSMLEPALGCGRCQRMTRHRYVRVA